MEQNRCIAGPILGRVFKIRELMFYSSVDDLVKFQIIQNARMLTHALTHMPPAHHMGSAKQSKRRNDQECLLLLLPYKIIVQRAAQGGCPCNEQLLTFPTASAYALARWAHMRLQACSVLPSTCWERLML